jgi:hypothetical protein
MAVERSNFWRFRLSAQKLGISVRVHVSCGTPVSNGKKKCSDRCSHYISQTAAWLTCMTENGCSTDPAAKKHDNLTSPD